ncbi:hypothetical protein, partial [Thiolapillus sp.]
TAISFRVHSGLQKFVLISFLKAAPCMPFFKFSNEGMQGMRQRYDPCYVNYFLRFLVIFLL